VFSQSTMLALRSLKDRLDTTVTTNCPAASAIGNPSQTFRACYYPGHTDLNIRSARGVRASRAVGIVCLVLGPLAMVLGILCMCCINGLYRKQVLAASSWQVASPIAGAMATGQPATLTAASTSTVAIEVTSQAPPVPPTSAGVQLEAAGTALTPASTANGLAPATATPTAGQTSSSGTAPSITNQEDRDAKACKIDMVD
jgi:hypothetical protein